MNQPKLRTWKRGLSQDEIDVLAGTDRPHPGSSKSLPEAVRVAAMAWRRRYTAEAGDQWAGYRMMWDMGFST